MIIKTTSANSPTPTVQRAIYLSWITTNWRTNTQEYTLYSAEMKSYTLLHDTAATSPVKTGISS